MPNFGCMGRLCAVALLFGTGLAACARAPPEQALRERIDLLQRGIDRRDAGAIEVLLAPDFVGNGGLDRKGARRLAAAMFLRYRDVGSRLGPLQVELRGDGRATVRFTAVVTGGGGGMLPEDGRVYEVTSGWRLDDGDWRMISAEWAARL